MGLETVSEVLTSIWTVWAVLVFAGIVFWAWRPTNRKRFDRDARIPLNDED
jgi:cytochrome c oxidase cbb3-type subunit IV